MGKPHRRFTRDFEAEAVRLVEASGRARNEIATEVELSIVRASQSSASMM
jgi:transposase